MELVHHAIAIGKKESLEAELKLSVSSCLWILAVCVQELPEKLPPSTFPKGNEANALSLQLCPQPIQEFDLERRDTHISQPAFPCSKATSSNSKERFHMTLPLHPARSGPHYI